MLLSFGVKPQSMAVKESPEPTWPDSPGAYLRARFRIDPHPDAACQVLEQSASRRPVRQQVVTRSEDPNTQCRAEITSADGGRRFIRSDVTPRCICPIFGSYECLASIDSVESGAYIVSIAVPDRAELEKVVTGVRDVGATVRLLQIGDTRVQSAERIVELPASDVTDKQLEAVRVAVELGYYETPRQASLAELAERMGISRSAVSQRLSAAESTLILELFEAEGGGTAL